MISPELNRTNPNANKIVILQDDWMMFENDELILKRLPNVESVHIGTGVEFLEQLGGFWDKPPRLLIGDVNLKGLFPSPEAIVLPELINKGSKDRPNTVGLRCILKYLDDSRSSDVPIVLSTLFSKRDLNDLPSGLVLPDKIQYLSRMDDNYEEKLISLVEDAIYTHSR